MTLRTCIATFVAIFGLVAGLRGQDDEAEARAQRLKVATEHIRKLEVRLADSAQSPVALIARPLLTYGDAARRNENGTMWAWGDGGRPFVFVEVFQGADGDRSWVHAITLTSTTRVVMTLPDGRRWAPASTAIQPQRLPNAEPPAAKPVARLTQMKAIAARCSAHEFWDPDNSRFELRLLPQPVYRYAQTDAKILDGTTFVLAHGTNPEILLFVEAVGESLESSAWQFHAARLGSAELHLLLDEQEVWKQSRTPGVVGRPTDPYWLFVLPSEAAAAR